VGSAGRAVARSAHGARPPLLRRAARARVRTPARRSPCRLQCDQLLRLRDANRRAARGQLHRPAPAGEARSERGAKRTGRTDRLLPRSRRARADPLRAARRRPLVERGVRGHGLHRRVPGRTPAGGRRPARRPLQRDPVGSPVDPRMVLRWWGHRSAHRRDPEGPRDARFPAGAAGLPDRPGFAVALRGCGLVHRGAHRNGACPAAPAVRSRGRPHDRPDAQLRLQRRWTGRPRVGHGLSASTGHPGRRRHDRPECRLRRRRW